MNRSLFAKASLLALAGALALAGTASAATTVTGGPLKVRGYNVSLIGSDNGAKDSLTVMFVRNAGKSSQIHSYSFDKGIKVTKNSIRGSLGRFGKVQLTLKNARLLKNSKGALPKGCVGTVSKTRRGTLSGQFKLVADKTFFRTVQANQMGGASLTTGRLECSGGGDSNGGDGGGDGGFGKGETMLTHTATNGGAMTTLVATKRSLMVTNIEDRAKTKPATLMHMISATAPGILTVAGGGASATVKAPKPFFRGTGLFTAETVAGPFASGTLGRGLTAKFNSIKPIRMAGPATLMYP